MSLFQKPDSSLLCIISQKPWCWCLQYFSGQERRQRYQPGSSSQTDTDLTGATALSRANDPSPPLLPARIRAHHYQNMTIDIQPSPSTVHYYRNNSGQKGGLMGFAGLVGVLLLSFFFLNSCTVIKSHLKHIYFMLFSLEIHAAVFIGNITTFLGLCHFNMLYSPVKKCI